mgnify:FL=1|jgi:hypothetical protein|tara:strand:- start:447 stop:1127 length:681 start_codon:yes stop_codon:yes gene_type:complete
MLKGLPYERQKFSQNGEDGILEYLIQFTNKKSFLEIGWGNGTVNNCRNLHERHGFSGTGIDSLPQKHEHSRVQFVRKHLTIDDAEFCTKLEGLSPAVFSIDIDSIDFHLLRAMLELKFRPDIIVHEYQSIWPIEYSKVRKLDASFERTFNYGASLSAYKKLLTKHYYTFVTCDSMGVNAFWIRDGIPFDMPEQRHEYVRLNKKYKAGKYPWTYYLPKIDNGWEDYE